MCMPKITTPKAIRTSGVVVILLCVIGVVHADKPGLGIAISEDEVGALTVFSTGVGLPDGQGDVAVGRQLYDKLCMACHGIGGRGGINDQLAGGHVGLDEVPSTRTIGSFWPYAPPLFDYIRRAMPFAEPGTLQNDEVYALVAYLLYVNGVVPEGTGCLNAESRAILFGVSVARLKFHKGCCYVAGNASEVGTFDMFTHFLTIRDRSAILMGLVM